MVFELSFEWVKDKYIVVIKITYFNNVILYLTIYGK